MDAIYAAAIGDTLTGAYCVSCPLCHVAFISLPARSPFPLCLLQAYSALLSRVLGDYADPAEAVPRTAFPELRHSRYVAYRAALRRRMASLRGWWLLRGALIALAGLDKLVLACGTHFSDIRPFSLAFAVWPFSLAAPADGGAAAAAAAAAAASSSPLLSFYPAWMGALVHRAGSVLFQALLRDHYGAPAGGSALRTESIAFNAGLARAVLAALSATAIPLALAVTAAISVCRWRARDFASHRALAASPEAREWTWDPKMIGEHPAQALPSRASSGVEALSSERDQARIAAKANPRLASQLVATGTPALRTRGALHATAAASEEHSTAAAVGAGADPADAAMAHAAEVAGDLPEDPVIAYLKEGAWPAPQTHAAHPMASTAPGGRELCLCLLSCACCDAVVISLLHHIKFGALSSVALRCACPLQRRGTLACASLAPCPSSTVSLLPLPPASSLSSSAGMHPALAPVPRRYPDSPTLLTPRPMRIVILTIGTRGDVQPYVALGRALRDAGHSVVISSTSDFKDFVEKAGLEFYDTHSPRVTQPPGWMTVASVADMLHISGPAAREAYGQVGRAFHAACTAPVVADVVIGTAMTVTFALDVSEAAGIPCWLAKLAPEIPSCGFVTPGSSESSVGWLNWVRCMAYWLKVAKASKDVGLEAAEQSWRVGDLHIAPVKPTARIAEMTYTPQLLAFSKTLFPRPSDYPAWAFQVGFWSLSEAESYRAHADPRLVGFMRSRDADNKASPVAVVTFGSMVLSCRPNFLSDLVAELLLARFRVLVLTGWAGETTAKGKAAHAAADADAAAAGAGAGAGSGVIAHSATSGASTLGLRPEQVANPHVLCWPEAPHDWLFNEPGCALVVHHGGAGTTGAALSRGIASLVIPVLRWADQPQWGRLVEDLGVGVMIEEPNPSRPSIAAAIARVRRPPPPSSSSSASSPTNGSSSPTAASGSGTTGAGAGAGAAGAAADNDDMPKPADKLCTFSGTAAGDAANKLGATMRGETSAESTLALLESCLCNAVLPPHEADAIHPLAGLLPAQMSAEQRMCVRHCVPCRRLRARLTLADTPMFRVGASAFFGAARARAAGSAPAPVATFSLPALLADASHGSAGAAAGPQASPAGTPARPSRGGGATSAGAASASGAGAGAGAGSKAPLASPPPTAGKPKVSRGGGAASADAGAADSAPADAAASADGSSSAGGASSARKRGRKASTGPSASAARA